MKKFYNVFAALTFMLLGLSSIGISQDIFTIAPSDFTSSADYSILTDSIESILIQRANESKDSSIVFQLTNGGVYFVTRPITNDGYHLKIFAENPDGAKPVILLKQNDVGSWPNMMDLLGDATFKNLHINSMRGVPTGTNYDSNKNGIKKDNSRIVFDGCYLERSKRAIAYVNALNTSVFFYNCRIANLGEVDKVAGFGDVVDCRSLETDTVVIQNCTMYNINYHIVRSGSSHIKYFKFDHNTGVNWFSRVGEPFTLGTVGEAHITNNITKNPDYFGSSDAWNYSYNDTIDQSNYIMLDTIYNIALEVEGKVSARNNNFFYDDEILNFFNSHNVVKRPGEIGKNIIPIFQGDTADAFFEEKVSFTNMPPMLDGLMEAIFPTDNVADANTKAEIDYPHDTIIGIQSIDASYPLSSDSYRAADDGFPLGDLNWFPENKTRWENGLAPVKVENINIHTNNSFIVYPNPAIEQTTIKYSLSEPGQSQISIFDMKGHLIRTVKDNFKSVGTYTINISVDDLDSGVYLLVHKTSYGVHNASYLVKR